MSISRQNSERLGGGGGPSGKLSSLRGGSGVFVHRKCCSASSLPHINYDRGGGAEKISVSRTGIRGGSILALGSLRSSMFVCCSSRFAPFPFSPPPPPTEPGPNLCKSLTMSNISVSFFLPFFLSFFIFFPDRNLLWRCRSCCGS